MWRDDEVATHGGRLKRLPHHPELGLLEPEFSTFAVGGRPELSMVVYKPATDQVADRNHRHLELHR